MSYTHEAFLANVRRLLKERGMTQRELAARLGVAEANVSQMLAGRYVPKLDTLDRVADAIGCEPKELLETVREKISA